MITVLDHWKALAKVENQRMRENMGGRPGPVDYDPHLGKHKGMLVRRDTVLDLWNSGVRDPDKLAKKLGVVRNTIVNDLIALDLWGNR